MTEVVNPFEAPGTWYKANLHTHTTTSDGLVSPGERVGQYRRAGYQVLALTDHGATNDCRGLSDARMLVLSGIEYHPRRRGVEVSYHFVGLNVPHGFALTRLSEPNRCIAEVRAAGGETLLAHPFWCRQDYGDFRRLRGLAAVEVYNATCDRSGQACSENEWGVALHQGTRLPAVGVDDTHCAHEEDVFECWTWLKMQALTPAEVLRAVRTGAGYASCGPKVHDFRVAEGQVRLRCSPAAAIHFIAGPGQGARRRAEPGRTITSFRMELPDWPYVRARVTDPAGRRAWTNPIYTR